MELHRNLTTDEVAAWLNVKSNTFAHRWHGLVAEHGFPRPLPGMGKLMWSAISLQAWTASLLTPAARRALAEAGEARDILRNDGMVNSGGLDKLLAQRTEALASQNGRAA